MNARNPRFPLVDSVRAIAALSVFAYHVAFHLELFRSGRFAGWGMQLNIGVAIFFVVSGFLLYRPFAAARHAGAPPPSLLPYAVRRALRIVPAYWVALPVVALVLGLSDVFTPHGIVKYFGFLQIYDKDAIIGGIGPAWTLCIEVSFYVALPLYALLARRLGGPVARSELALLALIAAASLGWKLLFRYAVPTDTPGWLPAQVSLPAFADHFAIGMALAVISVAARGRTERLERYSWLAWVLAFLAFVALSGGVTGQVFQVQSLWRHELRGVIGALLLAPAVFGAGGAVRRLLAQPWLLWLGAISYGFYLWHEPVIIALQRQGLDSSAGGVALGVVAFAITLALAAASWYLVERPVLRWGARRFGRRGSEEIEPRVVAA